MTGEPGRVCPMLPSPGEHLENSETGCNKDLWYGKLYNTVIEYFCRIVLRKAS